MTKEEAAALLDGHEYPAREIEQHHEALKAAGLVAVFGASDDLMEFRGAIYDEIGVWDGTVAAVDAEGLVPSPDDDPEAYYRRSPLARKVEALWCPDDLNASWLIRTDIPHATFDIPEDGDLYCRGVVFTLADARPSTSLDRTDV